MQDTPCILVQKDPKYTKLLTELTMEEAEKILVFMAVKSSDRAFMKLADRPKDKRTKVSTSWGPRRGVEKWFS